MARLSWSGNFLPFWSKSSSNIFEDFWKWRLEESPEFATITGNHSNDHRLESYNLKHFRNRKAVCEEFLRQCRLQQRTSLHLSHLVDYLQTYVDGFDHQGFLFPINYLEGVHIELELLISYMPFLKLQHYQNLLSRLKAFPSQVQEIIEILQLGIQLNKTFHAISMEGVGEQIERYLNSPLESLPFYKPFLKFPDSIKPRDRVELRKVAKDVLDNTFLPAFRNLLFFINRDYMRATRPSISVTSLPNGEKFYAACLQFHNGLPLSPAEIHQMGLDEVERISSDMDRVLASLGLKLTRREFAEKLKDDPQQYFTSKEEMLQAYIRTVEEEIKPRLGLVFEESHLPSSPLDIKPTPPSMEGGPQAYYLAGSRDRPGVFYVNTSDLKASVKYDIMPLALHEGLPGHHLQMSFMENQKAPEFRKCVEDRHYSDCPSRFPLYTAYCEGWGLYSEYLGYELGLYDDPYVNYGHLSKEVLRACRMVVDTGLHALGWTFDQAVDYMAENTAETLPSIKKEVKRYITWPGQATAYKVGELFIKSLRRLAQEEMGPKFHLAEFHHLVLKNMGTLDSLETQVKNYIKSAR